MSISVATVQKVLRLQADGKSYDEIQRLARISRPAVASIVSGKNTGKEPVPQNGFKKVRPAKRCRVCYHSSTIWDANGEQCWACTVREGM